MSADKPRVLVVDDEPHVLEALRDTLRRLFDVTIAVGGTAGLDALERKGPFAVIISDLRMPDVNGLTLLTLARRSAPETVRVLLTGHADLDAAIRVVNQGQVFRFLTKPCPREMLLQTLVGAVAHHRAALAERELLEQTVRGVAEALAQTLALADPGRFGRAGRLRERAGELARAADLADVWPVEIAALLSQLGCLSLPADVAERAYFGRELTAAEQDLVGRAPLHSARLVRKIPRLEHVAAILEQQTWFDGTRTPSPEAHVLRLVHDADVLESQGLEPDLCVATLRSRRLYDDHLLELLAELSHASVSPLRVRELPLGEVEVGMVFAADVTVAGTHALLVPRGHTVSETLLERIRSLPLAILALTVRVVVPPPAAAEPDEEAEQPAA